MNNKEGQFMNLLKNLKCVNLIEDQLYIDNSAVTARLNGECFFFF